MGTNKNVVVYYRNADERDRLPGGAALRFYETTTLLEEGPVHEMVMKSTIKMEIDKDPERKGVAVMIKVNKITELMGNVLQECDGI